MFQFVWVDDCYMGTALNNELSRLTSDPKHVLESAKQHVLFHRHLVNKTEDPDSGVYYHGYNGITDQTSCCKWGRGELDISPIT